ncbi:helix-turn-helix domain-containing protein [Rubritalea halochordaticola]|uniref:helix-turn-helix domain-containing protein n=1 Tax=Rubritalea halochordaticola TaxID=714537 RepID=UPI0031FE161A
MKNTEELIYEDWLGVKPQLLWALERRMDATSALMMNTSVRTYDHTAWYIIEGRAVVKNELGEVSAGAGEWLFPAQGERRQAFDGPLKFYSLNFTAKWRDFKPLYPLDESLVLSGEALPSLREKAKSICDELYTRLGRESWYLGVHACKLDDWLAIQRMKAEWLEDYAAAMKILGVEHYSPSKMDPRYQQAQQTMENHDWSQRLTMEELAQKVGVSRRQLERIYQDQLGRSPMSVFEDFKLERAKTLLLTPGVLMKEVAYEMGFNDISNFNRWFYRLTKVKASAFRESYQIGF